MISSNIWTSNYFTKITPTDFWYFYRAEIITFVEFCVEYSSVFLKQDKFNRCKITLKLKKFENLKQEHQNERKIAWILEVSAIEHYFYRPRETVFRVHGYLFWIFYVFRTNLFYNLRVFSIRELLNTRVDNTCELREFLLHCFQYEIISYSLFK